MTSLMAYADAGLLGSRTAVGSRWFVPVSLGLALTVGFVTLAWLAPIGWVIAGAVLWSILLARVDLHVSDLAWIVPPMNRTAEYGVALIMVHQLGVSGVLAFAYIAAVVYHHYDIIHRVEILGIVPTWRVGAMLGGSGVRTVALVVATSSGGLPMWLTGMTVWIALIGVIESLGTWRHEFRRQANPMERDTE